MLSNKISYAFFSQQNNICPQPTLYTKYSDFYEIIYLWKTLIYFIYINFVKHSPSTDRNMMDEGISYEKVHRIL